MVKHLSEYGGDAVDSVRDATPGRKDKVPGPSSNPATNIVAADVTMRAGSYLLRSAIEKGMLRGRYGQNTASDIIKNKTLGQDIDLRRARQDGDPIGTRRGGRRRWHRGQDPVRSQPAAPQGEAER